MIDLDRLFDPDRKPGMSCETVEAPHNQAPVINLALAITNPIHLPPEWHDLWDERAAIMEYDGGLPRERAEAAALQDILRQMRERGEL